MLEKDRVDSAIMELETLSPPKANPDLGPDNERGWPLSSTHITS